MSTHFFGIRHHGPGCARSLVEALGRLNPDTILIEGPPDADSLLALTVHADMCPPVALLVYAPANPQSAVYYPFAEFSPEWQAMLFGQRHAIPTRFIDLPQAIRLAQSMADPVVEAPQGSVSEDPLTWLATAAGYGDTDTWWDHLVEQRQDSLELFDAIAEMMTVARTELPEVLPKSEAQREAYMRQQIRVAEKEGFQRIAVVCGAWHVPALQQIAHQADDVAILKDLPTTNVMATWTPWTYGRLANNSGYGAGITSPGWYHHIWNTPNNTSIAWMTSAAHLLREQSLDASSAHIIEAVRLAEALASMRDRFRVGLSELLESLQSVILGNNDLPMRLIEERLLINDRIGTIPLDVPMLPLPQDIKQLQKRFRMTVSAEPTDLDLDVRQDAHLEKSHFLHRLGLLDIPWGKSNAVTGKKGSFHEAWSLQWNPEFELRMIEANVWGSTVLDACNAKTLHIAKEAQGLAELTSLVEKMLRADLRTSLEAVLAQMQALAAKTTDVAVLLAALPPLASVMRYGNTRKTDLTMVSQVLDGLVTRACLALPVAGQGLDHDAAQSLLTHIIAADHAIRLLATDAYSDSWHAALSQCAEHATVPPLIAGRAVRILAEQSCWTPEHVAQAFSLACSNPINPIATAEWLEGFLRGSGMMLVMNDILWNLLNDWVKALSQEAFVGLLPLLRRTFATFTSAERKLLAERVANGNVPLGTRQENQIDTEKAALLLPIFHLILAARSEPDLLREQNAS